jgi:hypothetical protein
MSPNEKVLSFLKMNTMSYSILGGHAPGGRVTAMPAPKVSETRYTSQPVMGYSSSHAQHEQQTSLWSQHAYRGLNASQIGFVRINLYAYEPTVNAKGHPCIVDVSRLFILFYSNFSHLISCTGNQGRDTCQLGHYNQGPFYPDQRCLVSASAQILWIHLF